MKKIIFFTGWPEIFLLLYGFIKELKESYHTKIYGKDKIVIGKDEKLILIGYSAGAIPLFEFAFKNSEKVKKIILIAPAGTIHRGFFCHCFAFFKELKYFYSFDKKKAKQILKESVVAFFKSPIGSILKINQIKKFDLIECSNRARSKNIEVIKIYSSDDYFMFDFLTALRNRNNLITGIASGHFAITHNYKNYAINVKRIIS